MISGKDPRADSATYGFDEKRSCFWIKPPGYSRLNFLPEAVVDGRRVRGWHWQALAGKGRLARFVAEDDFGLWTLHLKGTSSSGIGISLEVQLNKSAQKVDLCPAVFHKIAADHVLTHGRAMGDCAGRVLEKESRAEVTSHAWMAITRENRTLHFSHPLRQKFVAQFFGRARGKSVGSLTTSTRFDSFPGRKLTSAVLTVAASSDGPQLLVDWAEVQRGSHTPDETPQESGWNTWDYYRWTITEEEVLRNAEFIASDPLLRKHVRRVVIDDGWQYCYGEWEANHFFPSGMEKVARKLKRMGFTPGLWFAPTIVEPHSRLAQLHPEALATGASGFPCLAFSCMERKGFILDPTHPHTRQWWTELFRRYAGYGFRYFKLDFLSMTVPSRRFHDRRAVPGELMRYIIEPIADAVGKESRLLGCNYNLDGGAGLVRDVRVSADIHARWVSVKENVSAIAARFWSHERLWINDPDFALCRGEETSCDAHLHQLKPLLPFVRPDDANEKGVNYLDSLTDLTAREAEVLLSLVIVSGGAMNLSDNLTRMNARGLTLLRKAVVAEKGAAAIPLDLFRSEYPSYWVQKLSSGTHRILLINWSESIATLHLDITALNIPRNQLRNFWTDESLRLDQGRIVVELPPHACLLVEAQ